MNVTGLFKDHCAGTGVHGLHVKVSKPGGLRQLLCAGVIGPDVRHSITIGNEVDRFTRPDWIDVFRVGPWRLYQIVSFEIDNPDRTILTTTIITAFVVP